MGENKRKIITRYRIFYELRNIMGNPFVHIFGVGMPVMMSVLITKIAVSQISDATMEKTISTTIFLGIGAMIPMATILMGYSVLQAQELEKGIPERLQLFGIRGSVTICNRGIAELIFMSIAFGIYFVVGILFMELEKPKFSGILLYIVCMLFFSILCFGLGHAIASIIKKFSVTYCVVMIVYFACMIFGGMMGISYENMPSTMQMIARLLPVTYFNKDFFTIWTGQAYNFMPMIQSYLFFGAVAGILLLLAMQKEAGKTAL